MKSEEALERLHKIDREVNHLIKTAAILQWDQETYLPPRGVEDRAEQLALIEGIAHERFTTPEMGRLLTELGSDTKNPSGDEKLPPVERDFLKTLRRAYDREALLPQAFVSDAARAQGLSQAAWVEARKNNDFAAFVPHLKAMVEISRKKTEYWGFSQAAAYNALLDLYEPGLTAAEITALFTPLRDRLSPLLKKIAAQPYMDAPFLDRIFDTDQQARYNRQLMEKLGFDLRRGRLDITAHPFTTTLGFDDVRITTRYHSDNLLSSIFSTIHESGHAFYELNIDPALRGTCLAEGVSMGIHESQSRLWENVIGRSRAFWEGQLPGLKDVFPDQLSAVDSDAFYRGVNRVRPSLIRVEADEVSYSLHIILRFELEKRLFSGDLAVEDLPAVWRQSMWDFLGVEPETDAEGVLQDVHWSQGSFGYFPSYALGNLYGLQFWKKLRQDLQGRSDIPAPEAAIAQGDFSTIHAWLRDHIHQWGRRFDPADLLKQVTGETLSVTPFLEYIEAKYTELYEL
ncbi:carboxypeptidase M32 [Spirochaetia bacterium]|nr:carboxypeptidase M32 [Spirochaetia bacterium]